MHHDTLKPVFLLNAYLRKHETTAKYMILRKIIVRSCYTVAEIQIVGNNYTKERYILQEMSLHKDSTYCSNGPLY